MRSVNPFPARGGEHGDMRGRIIRLADRAPHLDPGRVPPMFAHAFAGVAAPAFDESVPDESAPVDPGELRFVQPRLRGAVDDVAVVEKETGLV